MAHRGRGIRAPTPRRDVAALVVRMSVENPQWGDTRIRGALSHLGHEIARTMVKRIRHDHGIDPAPERSRRMPGKTFLQAPWEGLTACDLFTVEVLTRAGLQRDLVFFVIARPSRRVPIAGIHPPPYGAWMEQMARNLTDPVDGCLRRARYLIHDRDPLDTRVFGEIREGGGVPPIRLPPKSPHGIVKLTKSSSIDPQDTGLEPAVNPPCWASRAAVGLNLTIPPAAIRRAVAALAWRVSTAGRRLSRRAPLGVGALIQRGGRAVAGMLTIATAGGS